MQWVICDIYAIFKSPIMCGNCLISINSWHVHDLLLSMVGVVYLFDWLVSTTFVILLTDTYYLVNSFQVSEYESDTYTNE